MSEFFFPSYRLRSNRYRLSPSILQVHRYDKESSRGELIAEYFLPHALLHDMRIRGRFVLLYAARADSRALVDWRLDGGCFLNFAEGSYDQVSGPSPA